MRTMKIRLAIFALLLLLPARGVGAPPYVLPTPDGGGDAPSPPSAYGTIVEVEKDAIVLKGQKESSKRDEIFRVGIAKNTMIFTAYGGYVARKKLLKGQVVEIWYTVQYPEKSEVPVAAVIKLWSDRPRDGFLVPPNYGLKLTARL